MRSIERPLGIKLKETLPQFPILFLAGPRQSGKTSLLKTFFSRDFEYINFKEKREVRDLALRDPKGFLNTFKGKVIIDAIHKAPLIIPFIREKIREKGGRVNFILSGSLDSKLKKSISAALNGQAVRFSLLPFSLHELANAGKFPKSANEWMFSGAYPEQVMLNINPADFFYDYFSAFMKLDIISEKRIHDIDKFKRFITVAALNSGDPINYSKLGEEASVDARTANSWINILEKRYILFRLPPYCGLEEKRYVKSCKLYFYDPGLLCSLLSINRPEELGLHRMRRCIFETAIVSEIAKKYFNAGFKPKLYYWRDLDNKEKEISLIEESNRGFNLTAIDFSQTMNIEYSKNLVNFSVLEKTLRKRVVYDGDNTLAFPGVSYINWRSI
jgi:predicted AAA+ superfamily ATPase